jgi:hypothetical protein
MTRATERPRQKVQAALPPGKGRDRLSLSPGVHFSPPFGPDPSTTP